MDDYGYDYDQDYGDDQGDEDETPENKFYNAKGVILYELCNIDYFRT